MTVQFFLGVHRPHWLAESPRPLFVSNRGLAPRKSLPRATCDWALDSGGFTELNLHGTWLTSPRDYAHSVRRYHGEIGRLVFASQQDWMCEPKVLTKTGRTVEQHQALTIDNYLTLRELAPDLPWMPVIQGWRMGEYLDHIDQWAARGVDLEKLPRVGIGSVCRRGRPTNPAFVMGAVAAMGIKLHAFGVKNTILRAAVDDLVSADSMAWSFAARRENRELGWLLAGRKTGGQNRLSTALDWFEERIAPILASSPVPASSHPRIPRCAPALHGDRAAAHHFAQLHLALNPLTPQDLVIR